MTNKNSFRNFEDVKCLWMKYGLVEYKLCDNNFNCEECTFDSSVKMNLRNPSEDFIFDRFFSNKNLFETFNSQYFHLDCSIVLKNFINSNYYIGFEPYALNMLGENCKCKFTDKNGKVKKGDKFLKVFGGWGEIEVSSPINFTLLEKINEGNILPSGKRWFGIIDCPKDEVENNSLRKEDCSEYISDLKSLMSESSISFNNYFSSLPNPAGNTMLDGGIITDNLLYIFGARIYKKLLTRIFSVKK